MTHDEFVGQVQARAQLGSRGDAERIIRATLETLAERLEHGFAQKISAQLPPEIGRHLRTDAPFTRLSVDDFFQRVRERETEGGTSSDRPAAAYHARVVLEVLQLALSLGADEKLRQQLPGEFEPLLSAGSRGDLRAGSEARERKEARDVELDQ